MSELTISNFTDILDPDMIQIAQDFLQNGSLTLENNNSPSQRIARTNGGDKVSIVLKGENIAQIQCSCIDFDPNTWEEDPCVHAIALLCALKDGTPAPGVKKAAAKPKAGIEKKKAGKKKNAPELDILENLDKKALSEFVLEMIGKNKEFKSQFLLYFSDSAQQSQENYRQIVQQTIAGVKGRKKYLKPGEAGKIVSNLAPLYKKAAESESKGLFNEAWTIVNTLIEGCAPLKSWIDGQSARFDGQLQQYYALRSQVVGNEALPFEMKERILESLQEEYNDSIKDLEINDGVRGNLLQICRNLKRLDYFTTLLETHIRELPLNSYRDHWNEAPRSKLVRFLADFYEKELNRPQDTERLLTANVDFLPVLLMLVERKIQQKQGIQALDLMERIFQNKKIYSNQYAQSGHLWNRIINLNINVRVLNGKKKEAATLAFEQFERSYYRDFSFFILAQNNWEDKSSWDKLISKTIDKIMDSRGFYAMTYESALKILELENRFERLREIIFSHKSAFGLLCGPFGSVLMEKSPEEFWQKIGELTAESIENKDRSLEGNLVQLMRAAVENAGNKDKFMAFADKYILPNAALFPTLKSIIAKPLE